MKPTILIYNSFLEPAIPLLSSDVIAVKRWDAEDDEINHHAIEGLITCVWDTINAHVMDKFPNLKIIAHLAAGVDAVDIGEARKRNIIVTNTADVVTHDTADLAMGLLIVLARDIVVNHHFVKSGKWQKGNASLNISLRGKTIGIVGLGKIGQEIAKRAEAFGMTVLYSGRAAKADIQYGYVDSLIELAEKSDFLVVSCVGSAETKNLINKDVLKALGNESYLINVSRGFVVNEADLVSALTNKVIAGAGLDVFEDEPNVPAILLEMDNVVVQPHVGSATKEARSKMYQIAADNINSFFKDGTVITRV